MKKFSHNVIEIGGSQFDIYVVASGDKEHPYTAEWSKIGSEEKVCDQMHFSQIYDAERWAEEQVRKKYNGKNAA